MTTGIFLELIPGTVSNSKVIGATSASQILLSFGNKWKNISEVFQKA